MNPDDQRAPRAPRDDLDVPPAWSEAPRRDLTRTAFVAAMLGFALLTAGTLLGHATTLLALLVCGAAGAAALAVLLPARWSGWGAAAAYVVAGTLLVVS